MEDPVDVLHSLMENELIIEGYAEEHTEGLSEAMASAVINVNMMKLLADALIDRLELLEAQLQELR